MADNRQCENPKVHDPHGWAETYYDAAGIMPFKTLFHVCSGIEPIHYRRLYHNETLCGLSSDWESERLYRPIDTTRVDETTCERCLATLSTSGVAI